MAKYVQPNSIFDSSVAFLRNVAFDGSIYIKGKAYISSPATAGVALPYALTVDTVGANVEIKNKLLGSMAFETSTNYYSKGMVDAINVTIDASIVALRLKDTNQDTSLNGIWTKLGHVDTSLNALGVKNANQDASITSLDSLKVNKAGDTMTGLLTLSSSGIRLDSVTLTTIDTSAEGVGQLDTAIATSGAIRSFVIGAIGNGAAYAWNGLTKVDNSIGLGGTLNAGATTITTNGATASLRIAGLATSSLDTALALVADSAGGDLKVRALGSMAWATTTDYTLKSLFDTSISAIWTKLGHVDTSLNALGVKNAAQDVSLNAVWTKLGSVDTSLNNLGIKDAAQDASIVILRATDAQQDASIVILRAKDAAQDASIIALRTKDTNIDTSLNGIWTKLGHVDTSLGILNNWNVSQDASIVAIRATAGSALQTASNGLTASGTNVILGGALTQSTDINTQSFPLSITGGLKINGTLTVDGSVSYMNVVDLNVSDNIIMINYGETGNGVTKGFAGLAIDRGSSTNYFFGFAEATQTFRVGLQETEGSLPVGTQAVATREDSPTAWGIGFWNGNQFRIDTSAGFTFTPGTGLGLPIATNMGSEATALVWNGTTVGSRELGSNAFSSDTFTLKSLFDTSISAIWTKLGHVDTSLNNLGIKDAAQDASIIALRTKDTNIDTSLNAIWVKNNAQDASIVVLRAGVLDLSTNRLRDVANINVTANASIFSYKTDNVAFLKKLVAGSGATITEDVSTITIAVSGVAGYVSKYAGTFNGSVVETLLVAAATHGLGVGPLSVTVYDGTDQVYVDVDCAVNGDITLTWTASSLSDTCKYIIMG